MEAKEKALELVDKYVSTLKAYYGEAIAMVLAKQCAIIAVDEILSLCWGGNEVGVNYWKQVKQEIEKL